MHHWCTRTCHGFTPHLTEHFKDDVGKEALRYDFLMNALLALTSFHIATETGNAITARSYTAAALQYHDQALSGLREVLPDITASTCNAIFASSAMLAICAVVSPFLHTDLDEMKTIKQHFDFVTINQLLQMATLNGAKALNKSDILGSFEKGKQPGVILIDEDLKNVKRLL